MDNARRRRLKDAHAPAEPAPSSPTRPRRIALINQKGGVGKTTTTVNLAAGFAQAGRRTLIVDMDPQAHATLHLGVEPSELERTVYDVLHDPSLADSAIVHTRENLDLLPAEVDLAAIETELAGADHRQTRLRTALESLDGYEFVLLDCPPSLGLLTLNGLFAAGEVVAPMQANFLALQGLGKLFETVELVRRSGARDLCVRGVALCMHDEQTVHAKEVVSNLAEFFEAARESDAAWRNAGILRPGVRRNIKLAECPSFGQTIFEYAPACAGARDYARLAEQFLAMKSENQAPEPNDVDVAPEVVVHSGADARPSA